MRGFTSALAAGYTEPDQENHALDMIRVGLQVLEDDRGALRSEASRVGWIAAQWELYGTTFSALTNVRYEHATAGELGLWLLESLHRSLTADLVRANGALDADPALLAALTALGRRESDDLLAGHSKGAALRCGRRSPRQQGDRAAARAEQPAPP